MNKKELQLIKQAIISEVEGAEFYKLAAEKEGISEEAKQEFIHLADEEIKHIEWLKFLFDKVKNEKEDEFNLAIVDPLPSPNIFSWNKLDRKSANIAVAVFGIAIQAEKAAIEFYENAAKNSELESAQKLYKVLANWERTHLETFSKEYESLLEEWWAEQEFSPF